MTVMHDEGDLRITAVDSSTLRKFDDPHDQGLLGAAAVREREAGPPIEVL